MQGGGNNNSREKTPQNLQLSHTKDMLKHSFELFTMFKYSLRNLSIPEGVFEDTGAKEKVYELKKLCAITGDVCRLKLLRQKDVRRNTVS